MLIYCNLEGSYFGEGGSLETCRRPPQHPLFGQSVEKNHWMDCRKTKTKGKYAVVVVQKENFSKPVIKTT